MFIKQLSVFVENKQGALSKIASLLADNGINMRAVSIADTQDFGILRMIVDDIEKATDALKLNNVIVKANNVIGVELSDKPGSLATVLGLLTEGGVNVEYMYAFVTPGNRDSAYLVLRAKDNAKAEQILEVNSIKMLTENDIKEI
ncbi:MAG: ACT domain-containing protein [Clostridia bacterium]|nr:ACT domain-containing protein [Clostridia bacterium]